MIHLLSISLLPALACGILMSGLLLYLLISGIKKSGDPAEYVFLSIPFFLVLFIVSTILSLMGDSTGSEVCIRISYISLVGLLTGWALFILFFVRRVSRLGITEISLCCVTAIVSGFILLYSCSDPIIVEFWIPWGNRGMDNLLQGFFNPVCALLFCYGVVLLLIPAIMLGIFFHRASEQGKNQILPVLFASLIPLIFSPVFLFSGFVFTMLIVPVIATVIVFFVWYILIYKKPVHEIIHAGQHLFYHIHAGVIVVNREKKITSLNPAAEKMFNTTLQEVYAKDICTLLPDVELISGSYAPSNIISRISEKGEHFYSYECIEILHQCPAPHTGEEGFIVILHDISPQVRAETEVRENLEFLQHLILTIPIPLFFTDKNNCFRGCNPAFCSFFFLPEDLILKRPLDEIIIPKTNEEVHRSVVRELLETGGVKEYEMSVSVEGTTHDILMTVAGIIDSRKLHKGLIGAFLDITEIHQYQEAIETTNKKLHMLSSITRHDILNQITSLMLYNELIQESKPYQTDPEIKSTIDKMKLLGSMIYKEILFSRDYEEIGIKNPVWIDIHNSIQVLKNEKAFEEVTISDRTRNLLVYADPLFQRVLYNLFENAIRHGETVTTIDVSFQITDDNTCVLIVSDNGRGVPDSMKEKIFRKGVGSNTGLGLFLTKEILSMTGIEIKETGLSGSGARFEMMIPPGKYRRENPRSDSI